MTFDLAKFTPLIEQVFESREDGLCATFEVPGSQGAWAQVMKGTLNMGYPLEEKPDANALAGGGAAPRSAIIGR
jgi:hypothetical protein